MNRSLRWAVLERDSFTCRYCGRAAPDVQLEVDHVDCNQGKRARDARHAISLSDRLRDAETDLALLEARDTASTAEQARLEEALELAGYAVDHLRYVVEALRSGHRSEPTSVGDILSGRGR